LLLPGGAKEMFPPIRGVSSPPGDFVEGFKTEEIRSAGLVEDAVMRRNPGGETMEDSQIMEEGVNLRAYSMAGSEISLFPAIPVGGLPCKTAHSFIDANSNEGLAIKLNLSSRPRLTMSGADLSIKASTSCLADEALTAHDSRCGLARSRSSHGHRGRWACIGVRPVCWPNNCWKRTGELADQKRQQEPANCTITHRGPEGQGWWSPELSRPIRRASTQQADVVT